MTDTTICARCGTVLPSEPGDHRGPIRRLLNHWHNAHGDIPPAKVVD